MKTKAKKSRKTRVQKRAKRTCKRLKDAALDIFSEKSFDAVTIEEITDKADVGKGTLYQYFQDKEQIVTTLIEEAVDHLVALLRTGDLEQKSLENTLERLLDCHYNFAENSREQFLLLFQSKILTKLQPENLENMDRPYLRYLNEIEDQIAACLEPPIDRLNIRRLACASAGWIFGFFSFAVLSMNEKDVLESMQPFRQIFVKSLCESLGRQTCNL